VSSVSLPEPDNGQLDILVVKAYSQGNKKRLRRIGRGSIEIEPHIEA
jgi:hypothetical protein